MNARTKRATLGMAVILAFSLMALPASSTEYVTFDGVWWKSASELQKLTLIQGITEGLSMGWAAGVYDAYYYSPNVQTLKLKARRLEFSKTFGAYKDLIDAIETEPAAAKLKIATIMVCLVDNIPDQDGCVASWQKAFPGEP
jgi:hypothetical protein